MKWSDALMGFKVGSTRGDLSYDTRDSAFAVPKSVVVDPSFNWAGDAPPMVPAAEAVIYEAHVRGLSMQHNGLEPRARGTFGDEYNLRPLRKNPACQFHQIACASQPVQVFIGQLHDIGPRDHPLDQPVRRQVR